MIRILLPLAVVAALLFAPMTKVTIQDPEFGETVTSRTGMDYVGATLKCWQARNFSLEGECAPKGDLKGQLVFFGVLASLVAAVVGVAGLLPFVGRATSAITTLAGGVVLAGVGYYLFTSLGGEDGMQAVQWGTYLAGGGGLLTLISGLSGMRGR